MRNRAIEAAANLSRLRRAQIISYSVAVLLGGFLGVLFGRVFLDHEAAAGNVVSRAIAPFLGNDPVMTLAVCGYLGIAAGLMFAWLFNRELNRRTHRAILKATDEELLKLMREQN